MAERGSRTGIFAQRVMSQRVMLYIAPHFSAKVREVASCLSR